MNEKKRKIKSVLSSHESYKKFKEDSGDSNHLHFNNLKLIMKLIKNSQIAIINQAQVRVLPWGSQIGGTMIWRLDRQNHYMENFNHYPNQIKSIWLFRIGLSNLKFLAITFRIVKILIEHIQLVCSLNSKLFFVFTKGFSIF